MPPIETPPVVPPVVPPATPNASAPPVPPPAAPPAPPPDPAAQAAADAAAAAAAVTPPTPPVPPAGTPALTLTLPKDAVIDAAAIERTTAFAKATGLTPEAAQHALNHANAEVSADRAAQKTANEQAFKTLATKTWVEEVQADATYGGEKYLTTVADVKKAADRFLTPEERVILNQTGWGNHPMLVKMFARIGQALANDKLVVGGAGSGSTPKTNAQVLYPNMNP